MAPNARDIIDDVLDATIVLSFTNIGFNVRKRLQDWEPLPSMRGRRVLITGANSGLGFAAARRCAELGALVHLGVRNPQRGQDALDRIARQFPDAHLMVEELDVSTLADVRSFATRFAASYPSLDVVVHNAGALLHDRTVTADGIETTLATHVVGPFLLTALLLPQLIASGDGRIITVASGGMYSTGLSMTNLQSDQGSYNGTQAYARAKRAQVLLTESWASRLHETPVTAHAMHPGWADTPGVAESLPTFRRIVGPFLRSPEQGADSIVWLAAAPRDELSSGSLWLDRRRRATHKMRRTREGDRHRAALFDEIRRLSGYTGSLPGDEFS